MLILSGKDALQKQIGSVFEVEKAIHSFIKSKRQYEMRFLYYDRVSSLKVKKVKKNARSIRKYILDIEKKWAGRVCELELMFREGRVR